MTDRFDLEAAINDCWSVINDISLLEEMGANQADYTSLANTYEFKFKKLWAIFEKMVREHQFVETTRPVPPNLGPFPTMPAHEDPLSRLKQFSWDKCPKCGINLSGAMSYTCIQPNCPTGMGSPYC